MFGVRTADVVGVDQLTDRDGVGEDMELDEARGIGRSEASEEEQTTGEHECADGGLDGGREEGLARPAQPEVGAGDEGQGSVANRG